MYRLGRLGKIDGFYDLIPLKFVSVIICLDVWFCVRVLSVFNSFWYRNCFETLSINLKVADLTGASHVSSYSQRTFLDLE